MPRHLEEFHRRHGRLSSGKWRASITVAGTRPPAEMAREIERRLLDDHRAEVVAATALAIEAQQEEERRAGIQADMLAILPGSRWIEHSSTVYFGDVHGPSGQVEIRHSGAVQWRLDFPASKLPALAEAIAKVMADDGVIEREPIEVVAYRDPEGPTELEVFLDGVPTEVTWVNVDPGAGQTRTDWIRSEVEAQRGMTGNAAQVIRKFYERGSFSGYIADNLYCLCGELVEPDRNRRDPSGHPRWRHIEEAHDQACTARRGPCPDYDRAGLLRG
jgi:hypothetical protein